MANFISSTQTHSGYGSSFWKMPTPHLSEEVSYPIIAFSHLGWDWVWQRPQQYLSRLSKKHPVLFVENRFEQLEQSKYQISKPEHYPNITVLQLIMPEAKRHECPFVDSERKRLLKAALDAELRGRFCSPVLWFYDPMAVVSAIGYLDEQAIVYDCMDELSQFKGAPAELIDREKSLLVQADVVFCGGKKMRDKRLPLNRNTHFFGTGVDCEHFGKALSTTQTVHPDIAALPGPVLGYFGVVDERIDYDLLAYLADEQPDWSIVMVGPWIKVDPANFPQRKNLYWLGGRPYEQLPAITKGFDVCLMPFALNAATEYINPTKALEYMAAGKPVVSTALAEVRSNFAEVAQIAETAPKFLHLCRNEVKNPSRVRIQKGIELSHQNTWEANLTKMERLIKSALAGSINVSTKQVAYV